MSASAATERRWASPKEAAAYRGVSTKTIYRWIDQGYVTGYRMGPRLVRVDLNEVDAMLEPIQHFSELPPPDQKVVRHVLAHLAGGAA